MPVKERLNFEDADAFYECLLDARPGLSCEQSDALNARLVLVLASQVGSSGQLAACVAAAVDPGNDSGDDSGDDSGNDLGKDPGKDLGEDSGEDLDADAK